MADLTSRMMSLFEGYHDAYGTYDATSRNDMKGGKLEIKSSARTIRSEVTKDLWRKHIEGIQSLGIIPIRDNNTCLWGCIDLDVYGISHADLVSELSRRRLPLLVCRSKSGGAHLFVFLAAPAPAPAVQNFLRQAAALIGHGNAEVFPKQRQVHIDRGDLGTWLNMPYFGGDESDRYCVKSDGLGMSLEEFVDLAESLKQPPNFLDQPPEEFLENTERAGGESSSRKPSPDFGDGPPCMQHLSAVGFPEGTRNKGLFALAVFAKKKFGTKWADTLERWNRDLFDPPLPASEVLDIIKGHEKKDYYYTCKEHPLAAHCNSSVCRTRRYGVGGDDDFPVISGLSVLDTDPPLWFMDVDDSRLELTTDQLQSYRVFHKVCMEQLFKCFRMMKQDSWLQIVSDAMKDAIRIEAPKEVGFSGTFYELLEAFCTDRHRGEEPIDLLSGRPFIDKDRIYFRLQDLMKFLENAGFRVYGRGQIVTRLKKVGGGTHFFNIKGKGANAWFVPAMFQQMPSLPTPSIERDPI